jgi:ketosteroid isomerase-like protein
MATATPHQLAEQYWLLMNSNDWDAVGALFHDEYALEWPQSGERIRGRANFTAVNANYPAAGPWRFTVESLVADEREAATVVAVSAPEISATVISFFEARDGLIWRMREYWPDPFAAALWRAQWVERM